MAYLFQEVDIIGFDVHTAINPVAVPGLIKEQFRFLIDSTAYNKQYQSGNELKTESLIIRPITKREFKRNHFWKNYLGISPTEESYWQLQVPFAVEPQDFDVRLNPDGLNFEGKAKPLIYVNSMGWSSNVGIRLNGNISAGYLRDFVGRLLGVGQKAPFVIGAEEKALTSIFKLLGDRVRKEIYISPSKVGDTRSTPRHLMISINRATGNAKYFRTEWELDPTMDDDERRNMLSILYGSEISIDKTIDLLKRPKSEEDESEDEDQKENPERVLVTRLRNKDFALTSYKIGTLFFPQEDALGKPERSEAIGCLVSNARSSTMVSLSMLGFSQAANKSPATNDVVHSLQNNIRAVIRNLPDHYDSSYSQNWHRHHRLLNKLREEKD
jgi:hypothetical protein